MKAEKFKLAYVKLGPRAGRLHKIARIATPITGYDILVDEPRHRKCRLFPNGTLVVREGHVWDFGTGAIDTKAVIHASLPHDIFCRFIDSDLLPLKEQKRADIFYRELLKVYGSWWFRRWYQYIAIRLFQRVENRL